MPYATRVSEGSYLAAVSRTAAATEPTRSAFVRHVLLFSFANLVALVCNGVLTFLLPRLLPMEAYGYYRLFILYGGFAGALHLGLLDGALLRWAARPRQRMKAELRSTLGFLLLQHGALLAPAMLVLVLVFRHQSWVFLAAAIVVYALVWNAATLGQFALQASKSFGFLSALTVINPALLLAAVVALNHWRRLGLEALLIAYVGAWLIAGIAVWAVLLAEHPGHSSSARRVWQVGTYNIRAGWSVLLALLLTNIALSLDRLLVSVSFSIRDFAIYSLAANALAVVYTVILSVSRVVFPYLSDGVGFEMKNRAYDWGEATLMSLWGLSVAGYFPLRVLVQRLLPNYVASLPILRWLMLGTGMTAAIYILHANYFRASLRQGRLLLGACIGLTAAAVFLAIARRDGSLVAMSEAMVAGITVWWAANEFLLDDITQRTLGDIARTAVYLFGCGAAFLFAASTASSAYGVLVYSVAFSALTGMTYGRSFRTLPRLRVQSVFAPTSVRPD